MTCRYNSWKPFEVIVAGLLQSGVHMQSNMNILPKNCSSRVLLRTSGCAGVKIYIYVGDPAGRLRFTVVKVQ